MRKSLFVIVWILLPMTGQCQNKCYHLLDYTCASCPPAVLLWNVDESQGNSSNVISISPMVVSDGHYGLPLFGGCIRSANSGAICG